MQQQLNVVVVDDEATVIRHLEGYIASAGYKPRTVASANASPSEILALRPDVILLRVSPPDVSAPLALCRAITTSLPQCPVIVYGAAPDTTLLQNAMVAGARRFLTAPFPRETLLRAIAETRAQTPVLAPMEAAPAAVGPSLVSGSFPEPAQRARLVTVFSPKGGVGTTTLAVNLAIGLKLRQQATALVDANISCGNVEVFLNINPTSSILQLVSSGQYNDSRVIRGHLLEHRESGIEVLLSPVQPEQSEMITGEHLRSILNLMQDQFNYVVVDTPASYEERVLITLEMADTIVVPVAPDLAAVRNLVAFLRVMRLLGSEEDKQILVLMRANSVPQAQVKDIERFLGRPFDHHVVSDGRRTTQAINEGTPVVQRDRESRIAADFLALAERLTEKSRKARTIEPPRGLLRRGVAVAQRVRNQDAKVNDRTMTADSIEAHV
jgi:pilus assembly protein CpaE